MDEILIESSPGISGDMLLAAFYDLGVPKMIIEQPLLDMGLEKSYSLTFHESKSCSLRGTKTEVKILKQNKKKYWKDIKQLIKQGNLENNLEKIIIEVFEKLAIAESNVHGIKPDEVHFHEIGSIDSIVDIVGVCAAINYLKPKKVYNTPPNLGTGFTNIEHGKISIPSPAVIDLISKYKMQVDSCFSVKNTELSTPTGIALLLQFSETQKLPRQYKVKSYGVGLGNKQLSFPNLLRILKINSINCGETYSESNPSYEEISIQEAWIDDQTCEDIASLVEILREAGANDVSYYPINMKKNRIGYSLTAIVPIEKETLFRDIWFKYSNTLGLRTRRQGRWTLLRRRGECMTAFGKLTFKQFMKVNGEKNIKPENDEIFKLQRKLNKSAEEIRNIINKSIGEFKPTENWK